MKHNGYFAFQTIIDNHNWDVRCHFFLLFSMRGFTSHNNCFKKVEKKVHKNFIRVRTIVDQKVLKQAGVVYNIKSQ